MKVSKVIILGSFTLIIFTIIIPFVNANGAILPDKTDNFVEIFTILPLLLIFNVGIESLVFFALTNEKTLNNLDLFISVAIVNLLTFPITQALAILVAVSLLASYYIIFYTLIELVPIMMEFTLLTYVFKKSPGIVKPTNSLVLFSYTLTANLMTFLFGLALFLPTYSFFR
ncbi:MAG: hypothetical protein ACFE9T_09785 [Promethearchaeota archaeon]